MTYILFLSFKSGMAVFFFFFFLERKNLLSITEKADPKGLQRLDSQIHNLEHRRQLQRQ
jgi:hypothetical protein